MAPRLDLILRPGFTVSGRLTSLVARTSDLGPELPRPLTRASESPPGSGWVPTAGHTCIMDLEKFSGSAQFFIVLYRGQKQGLGKLCLNPWFEVQ